MAEIMIKVPFHKPYIAEEEIAGVVDTLKSGWLTMGPKTQQFEEAFRNHIGAKYAVVMNSCTACLHLSLRALDLKEGDEVIIPTFTFASTGGVITYFKATPILVDVERETGNINVDQIERKITKRTKAIIPVHFGGQPCDMDEISELARSNHIAVIEDAAHALPATYKDMKIGTISDVTCFSFYATKTLTTGEGGMATTRNSEWAENMKRLRLHGISGDAWDRYSREGAWFYEVVDAGYKYNITDIQASIGIAQLKKIDEMMAMRSSIAEKYTQAFKDYKEIITPTVKNDRSSSWHLYPIILDIDRIRITRNQFIDELNKANIGTSVHFIPLHRHPFYHKSYGYNPNGFPNAEWLYGRTISLPIYPGMKEEEIYHVIENVSAICSKWKN